jgi:hypothetical protein
MKAVFIPYNQAYQVRLMKILDKWTFKASSDFDDNRYYRFGYDSFGYSERSRFRDVATDGYFHCIRIGFLHSSDVDLCSRLVFHIRGKRSEENQKKIRKTTQ